MRSEEICSLLSRQREFYNSGATLPLEFRREMLLKLRSALDKYEGEIEAALKADLGKSDFEGFMCEVGLARTEITYMLKNLKRFARKQAVKTPLAQFAAKSYVQPSPYGSVLIMSPWNYPFLLTVEPLCDAIAAGNTAILKPSAYSPATSALLEKMLGECFPREYVAVVTGGRKENSCLLEQRFDMIFFTGSTSVGKQVLRNAAENLTPVVLELGGKSPCVVDSSAKLKLAAKRIVFGKFLNCGQTCVAPDYIMCHSSLRDALVNELEKQIKLQFGDEPLKNADYGRIVNEKHFDRLMELIDTGRVAIGGKACRETLQIEPTVICNVSPDHKIMQEEIFGPLLPVLTYNDKDELISFISSRPKPLAMYVFSEDNAFTEELTSRIQFGGGCINDTVIHLATSEMGFGGVGESGMGSYHGRRGFEAFSHMKSIVKKYTFMDLPMRYQPYDRKINGKLLKLFLK